MGGGGRGGGWGWTSCAPNEPTFSQFHGFFFGKVGAPVEGWRPLLRRILDPPLISILPFHPQELVAGIVVVNSKQEVQHQGIYLAMEGAVSLQLSAKSVGLFEAFYNSLKVCNTSTSGCSRLSTTPSRFVIQARRAVRGFLQLPQGL